jgi:hypothetical protein
MPNIPEFGCIFSLSSFELCQTANVINLRRLCTKLLNLCRLTLNQFYSVYLNGHNNELLRPQAAVCMSACLCLNLET